MRRHLLPAVLVLLVSSWGTGCANSIDRSGVSAGATRSPQARADHVLRSLIIHVTAVAQFENPTALVNRPGSDHLYVAERQGAVRDLSPNPNRGFTNSSVPVIDEHTRLGPAIGEQGLLGLAFSPDGSKLITSYTDPGVHFGDAVLAMYQMNGEQAATSSRVELLRIPHPFVNHYGGDVMFGPDGFLYWGLGDGGNQESDVSGDPFDLAQNPKQLLGTMVRIDALHPSGNLPYSIPPDNPFADGRLGRPEVWAYGFRNPWRFGFDSLTGDLWIGDVGGSRREEIDLFTKASGGGRGANAGWSLNEGTLNTAKPGRRPPGLADPIYEYAHSDGLAAVIGGTVYRGSEIPELEGIYIFSDFGKSTLRGVVAQNGRLLTERTVQTTGDVLTAVDSFGEDQHHEMYAVSHGGTIFRLDAR